jgi:hypothetical protein
MRKFTKIVLFTTASAMMVVIVIIAALLLSGAGRDLIGGINGEDGPNNKTGTKLSVDADGVNYNENNAGVGLLAIYFEPTKGDLYIADCFVSTVDFSFTAQSLDPDEASKETITALLSNGSFYSAVDSVCTSFDKEFKNFIIFDSESFRKITDRMNGVVYNEDGVDVLLTGSQAVKRMDSCLLQIACRQFYDTASSRNVVKEILYIVNNTENNFSYPFVYDIIF